jgi:hypothetical protein
MAFIKSINWTYTGVPDSFWFMDGIETSRELETEPSPHECECPEPCNCDHENE